MPDSTPNYAIPYALGTDPRRDYPAVVDRPAAERIEELFDLRPYAMAAGTATSGVVTTPYVLSVVFPAGRFTEPPRLFVQMYENQHASVSVSSVTAAGADIEFKGADGGDGFSLIVRAWWLAVGA